MKKQYVIEHLAIIVHIKLLLMLRNQRAWAEWRKTNLNIRLTTYERKKVNVFFLLFLSLSFFFNFQ